MKIETQINQFLEKKKTAWSNTTLKSTAAFLRNYAELIKKGNPEAFLTSLQNEKKNAYTIQTYFIHAGNFYEFLYPAKENVYRLYRKENRNVFKHAYQSKKVEVSYETVRNTLEQAAQSPERDACLYILKTAQRASEAGLVRRIGEHREHSGDDQTIRGKGGRERLHLGAGLDLSVTGTTYYRVRSYLQSLFGISPHALRKLALTRAAERGAQAADLCEIAGWSSIQTAIRYLQPQRAEILRGFLD
jgi:integrase